MKFYTKEVRIAMVFTVGIVLLFFGLNFLKGKSLFSNHSSYYIRFADISGLSASNPIYADGYQVGIVKEIHYDYSKNQGAIVVFEVDEALRIPKGSTAEIVSDLMGNVKMNLLLANNPRERVEPGDTLTGAINGGMTAKMAQMLPAIEKMLPKIDSILVSVNTLLADPALARSLHNMETVSANLTTTTAGLNALVAGINTRMPGMMGKADLALDKANATLDNTSKLTANLAAVDVAGTMAKVDQTLANVQGITSRLNSTEGTMGLLMNDSKLYWNLNSTLQSADSLLVNFKAHPKRYVHFSIFGKKDR